MRNCDILLWAHFTFTSSLSAGKNFLHYFQVRKGHKGWRWKPSFPSLPPSTPRPRPSPLRPRLGMQGLVSISGPGPCSSAESSLSLSQTHTHRCIALHKSLEIASSWLRVNLVPTERRAQKTERTQSAQLLIQCAQCCTAATLQCAVQFSH